MFHVAVVCHSGIGTSQLLMEKLKEHFNFQIVEVLSAHDARSITEEKVDFIISTVPLRGCRLDVHCSDWKDAMLIEKYEYTLGM